MVDLPVLSSIHQRLSISVSLGHDIDEVFCPSERSLLAVANCEEPVDIDNDRQNRHGACMLVSCGRTRLHNYSYTFFEMCARIFS